MAATPGSMFGSLRLERRLALKDVTYQAYYLKGRLGAVFALNRGPVSIGVFHEPDVSNRN